MLQIAHLSLSHRKDLRVLIEDLNIVVNAGEKLAIIGEEGNGKTSLMKVIMGDPEVEDYLMVEGQVVRHFNRLAYLPQQLSERALGQSMADFFFEKLEADELDYALLYLLGAQLEFDPDRVFGDQVLTSLSGGERIKLQLMRLLVQAPDILFLDEPSNDLDIFAVEWLERFIRETDMTVVFISHDESLLKGAAMQILHLESLVHKRQVRHSLGKVDYTTYRDVRDQAFYKQRQIALKQRADDQAKMERHRRISDKVQHQLENQKNSTAGRLLAKKFKNIQSQAKRFEREREEFVEMPIQEDPIRLEFNGVEPLNASKVIVSLADFDLMVGDRILARSIQLEWKGQEKIGIVGVNGVGKTTLLHQIWELVVNSSKEGFHPGMMVQAYGDQLVDKLTPIELLTREGSQEERTQIMTFLGSLRYTVEEMHHSIGDLSGGQKAKLLLCALSLGKYNILMLDEPTRNISPTSQASLRASFRAYPGAMLVVSHDRLFLEEVCDRVLKLREDGLVEYRE